jgi:hypothetical protein
MFSRKRFLEKEKFVQNAFELPHYALITNCSMQIHIYIYVLNCILSYGISDTWVSVAFYLEEFSVFGLCLKGRLQFMLRISFIILHGNSSKLHFIDGPKYTYACLFIKCLAILYNIGDFCGCEDSNLRLVDTGKMQSGSCNIA